MLQSLFFPPLSHFNRLKLCGEPRHKDQQPNQLTGQPSSLPLQRPHIPPRYVPDPDETDIMYAEETEADGNETLARAEEEDSTDRVRTRLERP